MIKISLVIQQNDPNGKFSYKNGQEIEFPEAVTTDALKQQLHDVFDAVSAPVIDHVARMSKSIGAPMSHHVKSLLLPSSPFDAGDSGNRCGQPTKKLATEKQIAAIKTICAGRGIDPSQIASEHGAEKIELMSSKDCWKFINQQSQQ